VLEVPFEQQMDVVLGQATITMLPDGNPAAAESAAVVVAAAACRYTSRAAAGHFEAALSAWETAAAAVLQREGLLSQLVQLKAAMQQIRQQQQLQHGQHLDPAAAEQQEQLLLPGLDAQQVHQLLWAFLAATEQVQLAAGLLFEITGQQLRVGQSQYPPAGAVVSAAQLQPILDEVWELLGEHLIRC
jgi:hypothetical protein